ncbi:MAG: CP12 domain-containing protein [Phormidesmis sp.]
MTNIIVETKSLFLSTVSVPLAPASAHENRLRAALEHARRLTEMKGAQSIEAAIAWETVEELQRNTLPRHTSSCQSMFADYCAENPHELECRTYDC